MKRRPTRAVLDTNLLLLWLVARADPTLLQSFKRVQAFTYEDIELLRLLLRSYQESVTTPHILSETSNFVDQAPPWRRATLANELKTFIRDVAEVYRPSEMLSEREEFDALGLTDTALAELSSAVMVITMDYRLAGRIEAMGGAAINFNHYRTSLMNS